MNDLVTFDEYETAATQRWGSHPMSWPVPPRSKPRWWQFGDRKVVAELEAVFGLLTTSAMERYWSEARKGQSVYEDAGGYMLRCYQAMAGFHTEEPYTYERATADYIREALQ